MKKADGGSVTVAEVVNWIIERFRTNPPVFIDIGLSWLSVRIGCHLYRVEWDERYWVKEIGIDSFCVSSNSIWVEGVLNGKVRSSDGDLIDPSEIELHYTEVS